MSKTQSVSPIEELSAVLVEGNAYFYQWLETIHGVPPSSLETQIGKAIAQGYDILHLSFEALYPVVIQVAEQSGEEYSREKVIANMVMEYSTLTMRDEARAFRSQHAKDMPQEEYQKRQEEVRAALRQRCSDIH